MLILHWPLMAKHGYDNFEHVSDYQADCLLHGFKQILGNDYHEAFDCYWMYDDISLENKHKIWGHGFTVYGLLNKELKTKAHIHNNLTNGKYDYVIIPIHHTMNHQDKELVKQLKFLQSIKFEKKQLIVIDGWDQEHISQDVRNECGHYFKREMYNYRSDIHSLSFAVPKEKIIDHNNKKNMAFSPMIPAMHSWGHTEHLNSYIYTNEQEYCKQYQESYFAYTCKKAGWDCMRHYEILANGCIPWFTDIEKCPDTVLKLLPKKTFTDVKKIKGVIPGTIKPYNPNINTYIEDTRQILPGEQRGHLNAEFDMQTYNFMREYLLEYTKANLTTINLAQYILNTIS